MAKKKPGGAIKSRSYRIDDETLAMMDALARSIGYPYGTHTDVIRLAVRDLYRNRKLPMPPPPLPKEGPAAESKPAEKLDAPENPPKKRRGPAN